MKNQLKKNRKPAQNLDTRLRQSLNDPKYWAKFETEIRRAEEERAAVRKDAVLHLRINAGDLALLKKKAQEAGLKYQTYIAKVLSYVSK